MITSWKLLRTVSLQFLLVILYFHLVMTQFLIPDLPKKVFNKKAALNLGVLMPMSTMVKTNDDKLICTDKLNSSTLIHQAQAVEFAIDLANKKRKIQNPSTVLGFILLDDCFTDIKSIAQAVSFVRLAPCNETNATVPEYHDVVGVIGGTRSEQAIALSHLLGPLDIPLVSHRAANAELESTTVHPLFLGIMPQFIIQFRAIAAFLNELGFSYVSAVHEEGVYGSNGLHLLRSTLTSFGICLAVVREIPHFPTEKQAETIAHDLVKNRLARIVVLITEKQAAKILISAASDKDPGNFIWIGTDAWSEEIDSFSDIIEKHLLGAFLVMPIRCNFPEYNKYFQNLKPGNTTNPWFNEFWEDVFNCSLTDVQTRVKCGQNLTLSEVTFPNYVGRIIESVLMFSEAIQKNLLKCTISSKVNQSDCINTTNLINDLKTVHKDEATCENVILGDNLERIVIHQIVNASSGYELLRVATYDSGVNLTLVKNITWEYHLKADNTTEAPVSRCSLPCQYGEATLYQDVHCCWICQACRNRERLTGSGTKCDACPRFTWPDPDSNKTTCKEIPPTFPYWRSAQWMTQNVLICVTSIGSLAIFVFFVCHRERRVIRDSSLVLHFLILVAIFLGNVTLILFQLKPQDTTCIAGYFLFFVSFILMYGSVLVRSLCLYFTFQAEHSEESSFHYSLGPVHQLFFSLGLLLIQILLNIFPLTQQPTLYMKTMNNISHPYVELTCTMQRFSLQSFLGYGFLILLICMYLASKTRAMKNQFNESVYIIWFTCISFVVNLALFPAYSVAEQELVKLTIMAILETLIQIVAIGFLFLPKMYAVLYIKDEKQFYETNFKGVLDSISSKRESVGSRKSEVMVTSIRSLGQISTSVDIKH